MPTIPSGVLYFSVWKYAFFGITLLLGTWLFEYLGMFEPYALYGISVLCFFFLMQIIWFEHGDRRLREKWNVDAERTNCDRLFKAFVYSLCCLAWPKFV